MHYLREQVVLAIFMPCDTMVFWSMARADAIPKTLFLLKTNDTFVETSQLTVVKRGFSSCVSDRNKRHIAVDTPL